MVGFSIFATVFLLLIFIIFVSIRFALRWIYGKWISEDPGRRRRRIAILAMGALAIVVPYFSLKSLEFHALLSRVPEPLHVSKIEYRLEESWGIGLPGDNETGFVVYRMTGKSAEWARSQGEQLGAMLSGRSKIWDMTPVDDSRPDHPWHADGGDPAPHSNKANLVDYLDRYGFTIPLEEGRDAEFNDAIQHPGSFYSYGGGGSVTVIDPKRGKVYFAYAG